MAKVIMELGGWGYLVLVLAWYSEKIVRCYVGLQAKAELWLLAVEQSPAQQFPQGVRHQGSS
ncbi:MAG TPA: hypothetical protein VN647_08580 [Nitrospira sp.]|nr:hypothetical protein [Nitrospira sp.]